MRIPASYLSDTDPSIQHSFDHALDTANDILAIVPGQPTSWSPYAQSVYNLGGHLLAEFAQDQQYALSAMSWASGLATGTTSAPHAIVPGDRLSISGVSPLAYSGDQKLGYVVVQAVPDTSHFSYTVAANPGTANLLAGAAAVEQYFTRLRSTLKLGAFAPGMVASTSDLSTSVGLLNPDFMRGLTLENLQLLKTPWGKAYLSLAQSYGSNLWGMT